MKPSLRNATCLAIHCLARKLPLPRRPAYRNPNSADRHRPADARPLFSTSPLTLLVVVVAVRCPLSAVRCLLFSVPAVVSVSVVIVPAIPKTNKMAFVAPLSLLPSPTCYSSRLDTERCGLLVVASPVHRRRTPMPAGHTRRPPVAMASSVDRFMSSTPNDRTPSAQSVRVRRVDSAHEHNGDCDASALDEVYAIWNAVASDEGLPPVSPDERDAAQSTIHLLAEYHPPPSSTLSPDSASTSSSTSPSTALPRFVGAARLLYEGPNNVRLDRVCVLPDFRLRGIGRALVKELLRVADDPHGAIYVDALHGADMGFFSILGFEPVGNDRFDEALHTTVRTMLLTVPDCCPPVTGACVGLHHASLRVSDIERSLAFYGCIGFIVDDKFMTSAGARACFVQGLGTRLELVECPIAGSAGAIAGVQGVPPTGFDRLVFDVTKACTDLDIYLQHLARRNGGQLDVAGPPAKQVIGNSLMAVASIRDPDGMPIEFIRREAQVPGELRTRVKW